VELKTKPKFTAFFIYPAIVILLISLLIGIFTLILALLFLPQLIIIIIFSGFIFLIAYTLYLINLYIKFSREEYQLSEGKLRKLSGSIFNSSTTEIDLDKIIAYSECYHFIKSSLFNTKDVFIESEGTQSSTIKLDSLDIDELKNFINDLDERLGLSNLVKGENIKPSFRGSLIDIVNSGTEFAYTILIFIVFYGGSQFVFQGNAISGSVLFFLLIYLGFSVIGVGYRLTLVLLDIYFTNYTVSEDAISVEKGILSKILIFVPKKSLTDLKSYQEFWEKILKLKLIVLSIKNNPSFAVLKYLPQKYEISFNPTQSKPGSNTDNIISSQFQSPELVLKPNVFRFSIDIFLEVIILIGLLLITYFYPPLFILILPGLSFIYYIALQISEVFFTKYKLSYDLVTREFNFLSSKVSKISPENISSVQISQNWIDKVLNTCTITFFSLGGSESIRFSYIDKTEEIIRISEGIIDYEKEEAFSIDSNINFMNYIISNLPKAISAFIIDTILLIIANVFLPTYLFLISLVFLSFTYLFAAIEDFLGYKNALLNIGRKYIYLESGWWLRKEKITRTKFIKQTEIKKYPFVNSGEIILSIAGSVYADTSQTTFDNLFSGFDQNTIFLKYIDNPESAQSITNKFLFIEETSDGVEDIFKPDFLNPLIKIGVFAILFPPLLLAIPYFYLRNYFASFIVVNKKIIRLRGILYKSREEIYFNNIDFFEEKKDFVNKIAGNSKLYIYTSGNSEQDMVIGDFEGVGEIVDKIKAQTPKPG